MKIFKRKDIKVINDTCGEIQEMFSSKNVSISYVTIIDKSKPHLHKKTEEIYFVLKGNGIMTVDDESCNVEKDDIISIPQNKFHTIEKTSNGALELIVVTHPKFDIDDVIEKSI